MPASARNHFPTNMASTNCMASNEGPLTFDL